MLLLFLNNNACEIRQFRITEAASPPRAILYQVCSHNGMYLRELGNMNGWIHTTPHLDDPELIGIGIGIHAGDRPVTGGHLPSMSRRQFHFG